MLQPFYMSADFKQKKQIREPIVTQYDDLVFVVTIFDNGDPAVIDGLTYRFVSRRPDNKSYYVDGVKTGTNEITFDLGKTEVSLIGKVNAAIQLFDSNNQRLSSFTFNYTVTEDISLSEELSSQDLTLLEYVVQEGPGLVDYFTQAKPLVEQFTDYVNDLNQKADTTYVNQQIGNIGNSSPKGTYATLTALQTAFPSGTTGIYVVTADGKWYYWNGTTWTAGGIYQSTGISDGSVTPSKLDRVYYEAEVVTISGSEVTPPSGVMATLSVTAPSTTTVYSHGKNYLPFTTLSVDASLTGVTQDSKSLTATLAAGQTYKGFKTTPIFLKAGQYVFHREYTILSGAGTGNIAWVYVNKTDAAGNVLSANVSSIGPNATSSGVYNVPSDGYYMMYVYLNMNGTVTSDITIKFFNFQIEKSGFTSYEDYKGQIQTGTKMVFNGFDGMSLYNTTNVSMNVSYYTSNGKRLDALEALTNTINTSYVKQDSNTVSGTEVTLPENADGTATIKTSSSTTVYAHGKNYLPFNVLGIYNSTQVQLTSDTITTKTTVGSTFADFKLKPIYLKAGTYTVHREYSIVSGTKTGSTGSLYFYKCSSDGTVIGNSLFVMGGSADSYTYTITDDGYYIMHVYSTVGNATSDDLTVKFFNIQIEKTNYSSYEKYNGSYQTGSSLSFTIFSGIGFYNIDNLDMTVTYGTSVYDRIGDLEFKLSSVPIVDPTAKTLIVCKGDSLTASAGSSTSKPASDTNSDTSFPAVLGRLIGDSVQMVNMGIGGETSWMIAARDGAMPVKILPTTIPADKSQVRVYLKGMEQDYYYDPTSKVWTYLKDNLSYNIAVDGNAQVNPCWINGVQGTLTRTQLSSGTPDPTTGETVQTSTYAYYFSRSVAGTASTFTTPVDLITYASQTYKDAIQIIWMGQNDAPLHNGQYVTQPGVENRAKAMIDRSNSKKYIVMNLPSGDNVGSASSSMSFRQLFGEHFIDIRQYIVENGIQIANSLGANITVSTSDQALINAGTIPQCLRIDGVHGNYWYYQIVSRALYDKGKSLGYW